MSVSQIISTEVVQRGGRAYGVFTLASASNPNISYRVDVTNGRCSCPAWTHSKPVNGVRPLCKHLRSVGYSENTVTA